MMLHLAAADPVAARSQMGFSLAWHIVLACFGVGLPGLVLFAEWRGIRTGDAVWRLLARRWAKAMGLLFAVGAVSGTILSIEMGVLWSGLMSHWGQVIGLPFAIEGIAFFIEAIFLGIYLYGWDRLSPRAHLLSGVPIFAAGLASAFFVVTANAWMNAPAGYTLAHGKLVSVDPVAAMFNAATGPETVHMILAALMVTAFGTASVYAVATLRGRRDRYHRIGLLLPLSVGAVLAPLQIVAGDWAARMVAAHQPVKLAAMEGLTKTTAGAPESIGGYYSGGQLHGALQIPAGLSLLTRLSPHATVPGLNSVPAAGPAVAGDARAPVVRHDGRHRIRAAGTRRLARLVLVAAPGPAGDALVPALRRGIRGRDGRRHGARLDHHRSRPSALDRVRGHEGRGRGQS